MAGTTFLILSTSSCCQFLSCCQVLPVNWHRAREGAAVLYFNASMGKYCFPSKSAGIIFKSIAILGFWEQGPRKDRRWFFQCLPKTMLLWGIYARWLGSLRTMLCHVMACLLSNYALPFWTFDYSLLVLPFLVLVQILLSAIVTDSQLHGQSSAPFLAWSIMANSSMETSSLG